MQLKGFPGRMPELGEPLRVSHDAGARNFSPLRGKRRQLAGERGHWRGLGEKRQVSAAYEAGKSGDGKHGEAPGRCVVSFRKPDIALAEHCKRSRHVREHRTFVLHRATSVRLMPEREKVAHLLRRATFGPTMREVDAAQQRGFEATLQMLVRPSSPDDLSYPRLEADPYAALTRQSTREQRQAAQKTRREQVQQITGWWLDRMVTAERQLTEKLVFFWHGHWATSVQKVNSAHLMLAQQQVFRSRAHGPFGDFVKAMLRDSALILWLDGQRNTRKAPNENLARELMELFTLGIGNYTEADVKESARALTGWTIDRTTGVASLEPNKFDDGQKTILGRTAKFDVDSLADHLMSQAAAPKFVASRLWLRFGSAEPIPSGVLESMSAAGDVASMMTAMLRSEEFGRAQGQLVKQPVEWLVGAVRQLAISGDRSAFYKGLTALDQVPFRPPSVAGWPSGNAWLTTFSAQTRLRVAEALAAKAVTVPSGADEAARVLCVDAWTDRTRQLLEGVKDPRRRLALALASPEYAVH